MSYNLTPFDIVVRLILTMTLVIIGWLTSTFFFFVIGMTFLVLALTGFCPLKAIFGKAKSWD